MLARWYDLQRKEAGKGIKVKKVHAVKMGNFDKSHFEQPRSFYLFKLAQMFWMIFLHSACHSIVSVQKFLSTCSQSGVSLKLIDV